MTDDANLEIYADPICLKCGSRDGIRVEDAASDLSPVRCRGCGATFDKNWGEVKRAALQAVIDGLLKRS